MEGFSPSGHTKLDYRAVMGFEERYAILWFRMVVQRMLSFLGCVTIFRGPRDESPGDLTGHGRGLPARKIML